MIYKTLDISTAHYSQETDTFLRNVVDETQDFGWSVIDTGTGFIVPAMFYDLSEDDLAVIPAELAAIMKYAEAKDCLYIRFDHGGEIIKDLPTWKW